MILGITGGIATGKTTVIEGLKRFGHVIIEADKISNEIMGTKELLTKVKDLFGEEYIKNKTLNRKKIRELVFNDKEALEKLNKLSHPLILEEIKSQIKKNEKQNLVIVDVPLLYETGFEEAVDKVLLVYSAVDIQLTRLMKRDNIDYNLANQMIKSQISLKEKIKKADFLLENNGSIEELKDKINKFYKKIKKEA